MAPAGRVHIGRQCFASPGLEDIAELLRDPSCAAVAGGHYAPPTDVCSLQPHLTDRFAYAVRLTPALPFDERKGEYAFLGNAAFPWNTLFFDIAQDAVYWNTYNKQEKIGGNLFRAAKPHKVSPRAIAESEVMLGVTWEADSNEAATGTARIYLDGNFVGEERSAMRPQGRHADITMIGGTGKKGALDWIGTISQVVVYGNFKLPPDDLMERVFEGKE